MRPLILVTNDDGIESPGLLAAAEAVADLGDLLIAAPATQQTSMSRAFVTGDDVGAITRHDLHIAGRSVPGYSVVGSPVLAVTHALLELPDRRPDLCVSGINYGENVGGALGVSGTVSAALEAEAHGVPGIAASIQVDVASWRTFDDLDWSAARYFTRALARQVLTDGLPPDVAVINLNVPRDATTETEIRRTVQSRQPYYVHSLPEGARVPTNPLRLGIAAFVDADRLEPDSDVRAVVCDGVVSVTPLSWSMTARTEWQPHRAMLETCGSGCGVGHASGRTFPVIE
jgi:5'-nucleotidase